MTSSKLTSNMKRNALAQLALQLDNKKIKDAVGTEPSDEDLTALYENQLDATRRAQIMEHIANSTTVHERWIRCVESLSYLEESNNPKSVTNKNKQGFFETLFDFVTIKQLLGGTLTAAMAFVVVISILPQQQPELNIELSLNDAYNSWGGKLENEWKTLPADQKPTPVYSSDRSFFSKPKIKSTVQQILETGFKISLDQIGGKPFKDFGIVITSLASLPNSDFSSIKPEHYTTLVHTGQLAALAAIQCKLNPLSERLNKLTSALPILKKQLQLIPFKDATSLILLVKTKDESALCLTSQSIVDRILVSQ